MMAFDCAQFRHLISRLLKETGLYSPAAVELLLGTAAVESALGTYLRQKNGPALGAFQMEPDTFRDIWDNYLRWKLALAARIVPFLTGDGPGELEYNLACQVLMARVHYLRVPQPLPAAHDLPGLARYWKQYWNTPAGKGKETDFIQAYNLYCNRSPLGYQHQDETVDPATVEDQ